jgi:hypothetical protein
MDQSKLEQLRRELEQLANVIQRGRGQTDGPHAAELEYHLSQLTDAMTTFAHLGLRSMHRYDARPELLAHVDTVLKHTDEIRDLAQRVREVLLRPPPDEKPGFTE